MHTESQGGGCAREVNSRTRGSRPWRCWTRVGDGCRTPGLLVTTRWADHQVLPGIVDARLQPRARSGQPARRQHSAARGSWGSLEFGGGHRLDRLAVLHEDVAPLLRYRLDVGEDSVRRDVLRGERCAPMDDEIARLDHLHRDRMLLPFDIELLECLGATRFFTAKTR